jgi:hypothetical protein
LWSQKAFSIEETEQALLKRHKKLDLLERDEVSPARAANAKIVETLILLAHHGR